MARPRKSSTGTISAGQAKYVLDRLIGDRRLSWSDVQRYISDMHLEIGDLERWLQSLREATGDAIRGAIEKLTPGRPAGRRGRPGGTGAKSAKRKSAKITPEQLASRQLQGRYLGLIRQIPASRRAAYQKIAKERGREAAIKEMSTTLKK